ncbi:MAG: TlpA disulfide reductase family protein [Planctomycetota bacterium]|nr:TlpA disulfide reductase family protein [Planctomycetota bacterium]
MKTIYILAVLAVVVAVSIFAVASFADKDEKNKDDKHGHKVGKVAYDFELSDENGDKHKLDDYGEELVLMVFWLADCPSCKKEVPDLVDFHDKYGEKGLKILSLNVADDKERIKKFKKEHGIEYTVLVDKAQTVTKKYKVIGVPTNILVGTDGKMLFRKYRLPKEGTVIEDNLPEKKSEAAGKEDEEK